jgi:hypothetical protein
MYQQPDAPNMGGAPGNDGSGGPETEEDEDVVEGEFTEA